MELNINVRSAELADLPNIQKLSDELFKFESENFVAGKYNLDWALSRGGASYFESRIIAETGILLVACNNDEIVGYCSGIVYLNPAREPSMTSDMENLIVSHTYRNKGIGAQLVKQFRVQAKVIGARTIRVHVLADNTEAIDFYRDHGFSNFELLLESEV